MKLKIIDSGNSENLSLVNKIGDKREFTITRVHCITCRYVNVSSVVEFPHTANAYRQTTDKLMFKSVISTVR